LLTKEGDKGLVDDDELNSVRVRSGVPALLTDTNVF
jgi:hypothetical protein